MKHVIVYAHPNTESFNHAILETVKSELEGKGHEVRVRDLYELNFNPVLGASDFISFSKGNTPEDIKEEQITYIDMDMIAPNKLNDFSMDSLEQLAELIVTAGGILQPLILIPEKNEEGK